MKENPKQPLKNNSSEELKDIHGYLIYPSEEDIYTKRKEEKEIDSEEISKSKESIENDKIDNTYRKDIVDDDWSQEFDIPGLELDDTQEDIGSENEENDYYSLGGDAHNDPDENY